MASEVGGLKSTGTNSSDVMTRTVSQPACVEGAPLQMVPSRRMAPSLKNFYGRCRRGWQPFDVRATSNSPAT